MILEKGLLRGRIFNLMEMAGEKLPEEVSAGR